MSKAKMKTIKKSAKNKRTLLNFFKGGMLTTFSKSFLASSMPPIIPQKPIKGKKAHRFHPTKKALEDWSRALANQSKSKD